MALSFRLPGAEPARDLVNFLSRARRVNDGAARLIASDGLLQAYVGVVFPRGLLDQTPTVLGLRVAQLSAPGEFDVIVPLESLVFRIERAIEQPLEGGEVEVGVPTESPSIQWAAITPPREGWRRRLGVNSALLAQAAQDGVAAVAKALPENPGEAMVQKIRAEVWGQPVGKKKSIPWAAGFAADALGFLGEKSLSVHSVGNWVRLSSKNGYILVKNTGEAEGLDDE